MIAATILTGLAVLFTSLAWLRVYREAKQDERLDKLRGLPKGRYYRGEQPLDRWGHD